MVYDGDRLLTSVYKRNQAIACSSRPLIPPLAELLPQYLIFLSRPSDQARGDRHHLNHVYGRRNFPDGCACETGRREVRVWSEQHEEIACHHEQPTRIAWVPNERIWASGDELVAVAYRDLPRKEAA